MVPPEGVSDSKEEQRIDLDACKILLNSPSKGGGGEEGKGGGYERFHQSLVTLMSCGFDYRLYSENLSNRVIVSHVCLLINAHKFNVYFLMFLVFMCWAPVC